jgi:DNA-3-methyladenine glycosylase
MEQRRGIAREKPQLTAGPGVMSKAMGITTAYTGHSLVKPDSSIWIEDRGEEWPANEIVSSPRIGVGYAAECAAWPWRFYIGNTKWVSKLR